MNDEKIRQAFVSWRDSECDKCNNLENCLKQEEDYDLCFHGEMTGYEAGYNFRDKELQDKLKVARDAFDHIIEYWNGDSNLKAMTDALDEIIGTSEEAIEAIGETE
jgi:hypothetical protein